MEMSCVFFEVGTVVTFYLDLFLFQRVSCGKGGHTSVFMSSETFDFRADRDVLMLVGNACLNLTLFPRCNSSLRNELLAIALLVLGKRLDPKSLFIPCLHISLHFKRETVT
jgi:hypothetical protein